MLPFDFALFPKKPYLDICLSISAQDYNEIEASELVLFL